MRQEYCPWCGKPIARDLESRLEYPIRYHGRFYCPSCFHQLTQNTLI